MTLNTVIRGSGDGGLILSGPVSCSRRCFLTELKCVSYSSVSRRSSLLGDILHLHEAGALSVTPVHACPSRPLLSILNSCSLFKHPNRKCFPGLTLPIVPLYMQMKGKPLSQKCVARTEKNNPYLVLWTHAMTAFKRHEVDRCLIGKGEIVGDGLRGKGSDGDSRC